ncbi:hypothetical protein H7X87_03480 [Acetobacteraceae bacterium]|nr:hypothetical protein [Candidatus Parcubacteria bacterium]
MKSVLSTAQYRAKQLQFARLWSELENGWGFVDSHIHADRAHTFLDAYFQAEGGLNVYVDAKLYIKQDAIGVLHRGVAYETEEVRRRMVSIIELKIAAGEIMTNFIVDCSPDLDGRIFHLALELRKKYEKKIIINVGAYPIFGIKTWGSDRQLHLEELAPKAQFIVGLPERDARGDHPIGFEGHLGLLYELALKYKIPLDVHVDQTNTPEERGTQKLIEVVRALSMRVPPEERPEVWGVHALFGGKEDAEVFDIVMNLKANNIGIKCCAHAAVSMRQMRNHEGPTRSSIAPVRECMVAEVPVRLGTDNSNDLLMPLPKIPLLLREMDTLASALRYYDTNVLWKLARCEKLNATDRASVAQNLARDYEAFGRPNPWARLTE